MTMLALPKFFYEIHFKDGSVETVALNNPVDRYQEQKNKSILKFVDTSIETIDTTGISRVKPIDPNDDFSDSARAYLDKMVGPLKSVGDLRLYKYKRAYGRDMPLREFKSRMQKFTIKRKEREEDGDTVYAPVYRENGGQ